MSGFKFAECICASSHLFFHRLSGGREKGNRSGRSCVSLLSCGFNCHPHPPTPDCHPLPLFPKAEDSTEEIGQVRPCLVQTGDRGGVSTREACVWWPGDGWKWGEGEGWC